MGKNPRHFLHHLRVRPIRVLGPQPGCLHSPRGPAKPLSQCQATLRRHAPIDGQLFQAGLFIRKHDLTVRRKSQPGKLFDPRRDAAKIDFDDDFIYREVTLPISQRKTPMKQLLRKEALTAFAEWKADTVRH